MAHKQGDELADRTGYKKQKTFSDVPEYIRVRLPNLREKEMFGVAEQLLGASRIKVMGADAKSRVSRIPGKMKKRLWIREGDLVIIKPWEFENDKADVVWRYTKTETYYLRRKKMIPKEIDIF